MSKSILVVDTPESCSACPLFIGSYTDMTCRGNGRTIDYPFPDNKIQDWCPLKEVPEKLNLNKERTKSIEADCYEDYLDEAYLCGKINGHNACIDEIIKESD